MTVVVTAVFHPLPGRKEELAAAMQAGIEAVHGEKGCELYAIHDAPDGTIVMLEKWTSAAALDAHAAGEPVVRLNAAIEGLVAAPPVVTRLAPIPAGTPTQGAL